MRRGLCCLLAATMVFTLWGCMVPISLLFGDETDQEDITAFVLDHQEMLIACIDSGDFSALEEYSFIQKINAEDGFVDFYCGGSGFGSATAYCGFYYSETDDMFRIWCSPPDGETLTPSGSGWSWQEADGDNRYYTEEICPHFFYYHASY